MDTLTTTLPKLNIGDVVRVQTKLMEGEHIRKQKFEGIVIARNNSGIASTFTVRAIIEGFGVERIYPLHSPSIEKISVLGHEKVRRGKLYYLRKKKR
ncbi:MAG: 50S ribosomal protein L19 [bacterium]|nr:50S ribosomal protein L19 [bacterium]